MNQFELLCSLINDPVMRGIYLSTLQVSESLQALKVCIQGVHEVNPWATVHDFVIPLGVLGNSLRGKVLTTCIDLEAEAMDELRYEETRRHLDGLETELMKITKSLNDDIMDASTP